MVPGNVATSAWQLASVAERQHSRQLGSGRWQLALRRTTQQTIDRPTAVSNRDWAAGLIVDRHLRIDAEEVIDRRADVADVDRLVLDKRGLGIGSAVDRASLNSRTGK